MFLWVPIRHFSMEKQENNPLMVTKYASSGKWSYHEIQVKLNNQYGYISE